MVDGNCLQFLNTTMSKNRKVTLLINFAQKTLTGEALPQKSVDLITQTETANSLNGSNELKTVPARCTTAVKSSRNHMLKLHYLTLVIILISMFILIKTEISLSVL